MPIGAHTDRFDLDMKRCMFCGLCEEACPTNPRSIWLATKTYELGVYERNEGLYLDKSKMKKMDTAEKLDAIAQGALKYTQKYEVISYEEGLKRL